MIPAICKLYLFLCLLTLCFAAPSCRKDEAHEPIAGSSSITGTVQPPKAVAQVTAFSAGATQTYKAVPDSVSGRFTIQDLMPGSYAVVFVNSAGIVIADTLQVTVAKDNSTDVGTIAFQLSAATVRGDINPKAAIASISASGISNSSVHTASPDGAGHFVMYGLLPGTYRVDFNVANGYRPVNSINISVAAGENLDMGTILVKAIGNNNYVDTIITPTGRNTTENDLLQRAPYDSAIVIIGNLTIFGGMETEALQSALNKITAITGYVNFVNAEVPAITMNRLTSLGALLLGGSNTLSSINLSSLQQISIIQLWNAPLLTHVDMGSLQVVKREIDLASTGLTNLDMLKTATLYFSQIQLVANRSLTDISALRFGRDTLDDLYISSNSALTSLAGLEGIRVVTNSITVRGNAALTTLTGMDNIVSAKNLNLQTNPQLSALCPAKQVINSVKELPPYTVKGYDIYGQPTTYTVDPFTAMNNGIYSNETDVIAAIGQCP